MPFTNNNSVLPVLPKPDHAKGGIAENMTRGVIEDKELRKKLRNRQSALAARERKKARMMELERQVAELQEVNRRFDEDNQYLRARLDMMMRKCAEAGVQLDNDHEFVKCYGMGPQMHMNYQHHHAVYPPVNAEQNRAANLRMEIKELGDRQQQILESMSYNGLHNRPQMPANNPMPVSRGTCPYPTHAMPIKQEYNVSNVGFHHRHASSPFAANFPNFNQLTPETMQQASLPLFRPKQVPDHTSISTPVSNLSDTNLASQQSLPSIAAVLGSPEKRPCSEISNCQQRDGQAQSKVREEMMSTACVPNLFQSEPVLQHPVLKAAHSLPSLPITGDGSCSEGRLSPDVARSRMMTGSPDELRDYNLNSAASPFLSCTEKSSDDFCCIAEQGDQGLPILDFQDIVSSELSADSPSGLSGSDSGVSMDDSLDWITENPIFDL